MKERLRKRWGMFRETIGRERRRITLFVGFLAMGALMFEAGFVQGVAHVPAPVVIEKPVTAADVCAAPVGVAGSADTQDTSVAVSADSSSVTGGCRFVGSKNSTLYHLPTCAPAKRIKPENRVCFASEEEAHARGYKPGCLK